jgi:hypothetical protein
VSPVSDDDKRFTFGLIWDVAEVLRSHGYPIPEHRGRYDHGDKHRRIGEALFRLIYRDTDLGTGALVTPAAAPDDPLALSGRGVEP